MQSAWVMRMGYDALGRRTSLGAQGVVDGTTAYHGGSKASSAISRYRNENSMR